jgi:hypothetical protein
MSSVFPKFGPDEGSDEVKVKLANPESYKMLASGIQYEDIFSGIKGPSLNNENQKVTISYQLFAQNTKLIRRERFKNTLADFAVELDFGEDFTKAMLKMKLTGYRRIIIPPEINNTKEYRIVDVLLQSIKEKGSDEISFKEKTKKVKEVEEEAKETSNPKVVSENKIEKAVAYSIANIGTIAAAATASAPVILQVIREIKITFSKPDGMSRDTESLPPKVRLDEEIIYPAQNIYINETKPPPPPQPKQWAGVGPKVTYQVMDHGEGEVMSRYRQGCFQYKEGGSMEAISFEGSAMELAIKLGPGFEEAMLEAIVGMKVNGRRIIFILPEVSGIEENTFIELKLTSIRDLNARSRI